MAKDKRSACEKRAIYVIIGVDGYGFKEVLGMWIDGSESSSFWSSIFEELRERGYIKKDELYWEDGLLFSIADNMKAEEQYNGLRVIKFDAQKWRSGTGAYYFGDCTASWPQNGTWSDYNIGSQAIS